jgi:hypothetical protein
VPEIIPVDAPRDNPGGRVPADIDQMYEGVPPPTVRVLLYANPISPLGTEAVVMVSTAFMVIDRTFVADPPTLSVTLTVKL